MTLNHLKASVGTKADIHTVDVAFTPSELTTLYEALALRFELCAADDEMHRQRDAAYALLLRVRERLLSDGAFV